MTNFINDDMESIIYGALDETKDFIEDGELTDMADLHKVIEVMRTHIIHNINEYVVEPSEVMLILAGIRHEIMSDRYFPYSRVMLAAINEIIAQEATHDIIWEKLN